MRLRTATSSFSCYPCIDVCRTEGMLPTCMKINLKRETIMNGFTASFGEMAFSSLLQQLKIRNDFIITPSPYSLPKSFVDENL